MTAQERLDSEPSLLNQGLEVVGGRVWCNPCGAYYGHEHSQSLTDHIKTAKHKTKLDDIKSNSAKGQYSIQKVVDRMTISSSSNDKMKSRLTVVHALLDAGIPLSKTDRPAFHKVIVNSNSDFGHSSNLRDCIPAVRLMALEQLKEELQRVTECSISYDGTSKFGTELFCVIIRAIMEGVPQQRLLYLGCYDDPLNADVLTSELVRITEDAGIVGSALVAQMRDRASVNEAVNLAGLKASFSRVIDVACTCHTLNNAAAFMDLPHVETSISDWCALLGHKRASAAFFRIFGPGRLDASKSDVRWLSMFAPAYKVYRHYDKITQKFLPYLQKEKICPAMTARLVDAFDDSKNFCYAFLCCFIDFGRLYLEAIYFLEADTFLAPFVHRLLRRILEIAHHWRHPRLDRALLRYPPCLRSAIRHRARLCVYRSLMYMANRMYKAVAPFADFEGPVIQVPPVAKIYSPDGPVEAEGNGGHIDFPWHGPFDQADGYDLAPLERVLDDDKVFHGTRPLQVQTRIYEAAEMLQPCFLVDMSPAMVTTKLDSALKYLYTETPAAALNKRLLAQLPNYKIAARGVREMRPVALWQWWQARSGKDHALSAWYELAAKTALIQPSSAAPERTFSIVDGLLRSSQSSALIDLIQASAYSRVDSNYRAAGKNAVAGVPEIIRRIEYSDSEGE